MKKKEITGMTFGRLTAVRSMEYAPGGYIWECLCECGNKIFPNVGSLTSGNTKSCGCLHRELVSKRFTKHGLRQTKIYHTWLNMKTRSGRYKTKNRNDSKYYDGRGIGVCDEWAASFPTFYEWAMANGYDDSLEIDRIDNDGNYTPDNCQFITHKENSRKRPYCTERRA